MCSEKISGIALTPDNSYWNSHNLLTLPVEQFADKEIFKEGNR